MKSRLLPTAAPEEHEQGVAAPKLQRRESDIVDTFDEVAEAVASEIDIETIVEKPQPSARPAPQVSARPQGRFLAVAILLVCITSVGYSLWSTFLRDAAYGVVTGKVTKLSPPWSGKLTAVYVFAGDNVRQGDVLAIVDDPQLQANIDRLGDELRNAQAELDAQAALLALAAREHRNEAAEMEARYFDAQGELLSEQSRLAEITSKLQRRQELAHTKAYSEEEIESLSFMQQGLTAKIENLQQSVNSLHEQLLSLPNQEDNSRQLKPWLAKIESLQAEILRLREKQRRGTIRAPFSGTVVKVAGHVGERVDPNLPLLELMPAGSLEFVLYVEQEDASDYRVRQRLEVFVEPVPEAIVCEVTRIGQRLEKPQAHIIGRYRPEQRLLPVYLTPTNLPSEANLHLGSTVRLPTSFLGND